MSDQVGNQNVGFLMTRLKYLDVFKIVAITQRFYHKEMPPKGADRTANSEDPDQSAPKSLGLHSLLLPICRKTKEIRVRWGIFQ